MEVIRVASFSDGDAGGNPAGVWIGDVLPTEAEMQMVAREVGYSETVFAIPVADKWRVRYFSPEAEVPFCGHATIALGAVLAKRQGAGVYPLVLNATEISVEGFAQAGRFSAALQSPTTSSSPVSPCLVASALDLFGYSIGDLDSSITASFANAGAEHLIIALNSRAALAAMEYDLDAGRALMRRLGVVTVALIWAESPQLFHVRNPFAFGGVYEDPATGAAAAALMGYLRDLSWPHDGCIDIVQGEDMGARSLIRAECNGVAGESIRVSGSVRWIDNSTD